MVKFKIEQVREAMGKPENIRNISVIAHVDHGKSTLCDSLIAKAGIIASNIAGEARELDTREDEKDRGITIKSTGISMYYECDVKGDGKTEPFLTNLIDSPGHVDFSSEVTAALRVTDGALVVVDCVEGVCVQTGTVLRQALTEMIRPVLMVNKIDRQILELKLGAEEMYQNFVRVIDLVNVIISNYDYPDMGDLLVYPNKGNVAFGSGKECWAFTITKFARIYAKKYSIDFEKMMQKLWGDNYFDPVSKKWYNDPEGEGGQTLKRAFCSFVMEPILKVCNSIMEGNSEQISKMLTSLEITLTSEERDLKGKTLLKTVMSKWLNAADTLLEMIVLHLPSPKTAQKYRVSYLYEGPQDDLVAESIRNCDPNGPLILYVSKMVPSDKGRFYAFGRVFGGTVYSGQKVRILGPNYIPGKKDDLFEKAIQRTVLMMGRNVQYIPDVPCGNTVGLVGVDEYLLKAGTITDYEGAHLIRPMKYSVAPVVRVAVQPKNPSDVAKLIEGLKRLSKSDPLIQTYCDESGQHIIAGCGELHVEICIKDLQEFAGCEIKISEPLITYKETISAASNQVCLAKSSNKLNRLFVKAEPLADDLTNLIEAGKIGPNNDLKERQKVLVDEFQWTKNDSQSIWAFGPENNGPNVLVDTTTAVQYMKEIRDSLQSAFQWVTREGVLTEEATRSVRYNLVDAVIHSDPVHRGSSQIIQAARRVYYAASLTAEPRLQEPIFLAEITTPVTSASSVYQCLNQRRGIVIEDEPLSGTNMSVIKAYIPVAESFGFPTSLRSMTSGQAFPQCVFSHWAEVTGDPLQPDSKAGGVVAEIRKRKGLKETVPSLDNFLDKL